MIYYTYKIPVSVFDVVDIETLLKRITNKTFGYGELAYVENPHTNQLEIIHSFEEIDVPVICP